MFNVFTICCIIICIIIITYYFPFSRLSWFIIYSIFVLALSAVGVLLLFTLQMFQHTHFLPIFLLVVLYSFSVIMFAFMITPFFDKSRVSNFQIMQLLSTDELTKVNQLLYNLYLLTFLIKKKQRLCYTMCVKQKSFYMFQTAGVLGNFAVTILSLMYFIQVFVDDSSSISFWLVSLLSPTGVALAMDKVNF